MSQILPGQLLRLSLNFYEYEMLIEKEIWLYFTAFLNNREIIGGNIQLRATFLTENWIYSFKTKAATFCNARPMSS